jgi:5-methylcytosine-specific restriction endonuclease McrA
VQCLLLNADYTFLNMVHWKRALGLLEKGKVEVLRCTERIVNSAGGKQVKVPMVMRLIKLIRTLYRSRVPLSKRNILIRDDFKCGYCGREAQHLTVDHILPRSKGGDTTFENCVAACTTCNHLKGNRTPREAGMSLRVKPYQPTIAEFLRIKMNRLGVNDVLSEIGM